MKHPIIDKILTEWAYRVDNGMPNPKNPIHLIHLRESLQHLKIDEEVIDLMMDKLYEDENKVPERVKKKAKALGLVWKFKGYGKQGEEGITHRVDYKRGMLVPVDDKEKEKGQPQGEDPKQQQQEPEQPDPEANKVKMDIDMKGGFGDNQEDDTTDEQPKRMIAGKNKSLKSINSSEQEAFTKDLEPSGDSFKAKNQEYAIGEPPSPFKLPESLYQNNKFPGRYLNVISRMMNTKFSEDTKKWSHFSDIEGGAGRISAQAGELMTMVGTAMSDEEFEEFSNALLQHEQQQIEAHPELKKEGTRIIGKSWIQSAANNRKAIRQRLLKQYGEGVEIVNTAWDVKDEFEALGNDNYEANKGFSSDMYVKIKTQDGTEILDEVSLKKSTLVNFLNSSTGKFEEWDEELEDSINPKIYRQNQRQRLVEGVEQNKSQLKELLDDGEYNKVEDALNAKAGSRKKAQVLWKAMNKLSDSGNAFAKSWIEKHREAHIDYQKEAVRQITENDKLKSGMLKEISSEFPLKAVSEGEETMAIGPYSLDKMTMKSIFGTSDYDEIKQKLVAKEGPPPYVGYQADVEGEVIPIAQIGIREDGVGYGGQIKFEMILDRRFAKVLEKAHSDVYGGE